MSLLLWKEIVTLAEEEIKTYSNIYSFISNRENTVFRKPYNINGELVFFSDSIIFSSIPNKSYFLSIPLEYIINFEYLKKGTFSKKYIIKISEFDFYDGYFRDLIFEIKEKGPETSYKVNKFIDLFTKNVSTSFNSIVARYIYGLHVYSDLAIKNDANLTLLNPVINLLHKVYSASIIKGEITFNEILDELTSIIGLIPPYDSSRKIARTLVIESLKVLIAYGLPNKTRLEGILDEKNEKFISKLMLEKEKIQYSYNIITKFSIIDGSIVVKCPNCGAVVDIEKNQISDNKIRCPYCNTVFFIAKNILEKL